MQMMILPTQKGWFAMDSIDLTGVSMVNIMAGYQKTMPTNYAIEVRLDKEDGKVIGTGTIAADKSNGGGNKAPIQTASAHFTIQPVTDGAFHTLYFISTPAKAGASGTAAILNVQFR